ncbi:MAG TPA: D-alanyl-D-alanine carboxypeptidase/D-alanyl-D-alanine-endopeptidase [Methylophilaceae bacterium]|nr:D-alanyl-D-alanine carboxypeptidase/D-alanyl-D-alanine-endopeptidase [Methylophilaceae bacterium]
MLRRLLNILPVFTLLAAASAQAALPEAVSHALQKEGLPLNSVAMYVQRLDQAPSQPQVVSHQADQPLNPASVMKLVTTYAGLELLGPAYRWRTEIYHDGSLSNGVLNGNLYIKGYGAPDLMLENFWLMLSRLRQAGVREIRDDLVLDSSYFSSQAGDSSAFDGEPYRAYNVLPGALLVNLKASSFRFQADEQEVTVSQEPALPEIKIINRLKLAQSDCGDWKKQLEYEVSRPDASGFEISGSGKAAGNSQATVSFHGTYAASCGEKFLELSVLDNASYTLGLFRQIWQQLGGSLHGELKLAEKPASATLLLEQQSWPLSDVVRRINKYSNNLMARQLLLTIATEKVGVPGTEAGGAQALRAWLADKGMDFPELVIENGAGLSRAERISARHLGELLAHAYASPVMPELMSSLPILSVDGTAEHRLKNSTAQGRAHLKTGSLEGVRSIAGYVLDRNGRRWAVVFMVNHPRAGASRAAQDALLQWIYEQ